MPKYTIDGTTLSDVADAVRELDGNPDTMTPTQMASRIRAVQPGGADLSVIADDYDTTATYDVGDYCIHEGGLYVCTTAISTAEAWTAGHWEEVTVGDELSDLKSDLNQKYEKPSTGIPASDLAQGVIPDVSGKADKVQNATSGNFASLDSNGNLTDSGHKHSDYLTEAPVTDVQIDGTSILNNGVANIPKAGNSTLGAMIVGNGLEVSPSGRVYTSRAGSVTIKAQTDEYNSITPKFQHEATFYGLAKAAGDSSQSASSNAVGTYTDDAKIAIQKMLGIYEAPWELIRSDTFTHTESADYTIEVDNNGESFDLTDLYLEVWLDALSDDSAVQGNYGRVDLFFDIASYYSAYLNETTISVGQYRKGAYVLLKKEKGAVYKINTSYATMGSDRVGLTSTGRVDQNRALMMMIDVTWKKVRITSIKGIVHYILYGKRKWQ